jgi:hypothetical protein
MMSIALVPFLLWYALRGRNPKGRAFARLVAAGVPAVLFLGWNLLAPLPREVAAEQAMHRPAIASYWLVTFAARPIDYLTGDIAFDASDWNPLRASLTRGVRDARYDSSNNIERANGIRWSVLVITFVATVAVLRKRRQKSLPEPVRWELVFFVALAAGAYWLSLSPRSFAPGGIGMGPSLWVHKLLPHFRVPSRFGPVVHFACLVIAGYALTAWLARSKSRPFRTGILVLAPFVAVLEFLPLHPVWAIAAQPDRAELVLPGTNYCGTGVFFPYVGIRPGSLEEFDYYKTIQQMKRTSCILGNIPLDDPRNAAFYAKIGTDRFASAPAATASALVEFLKCSGFEWVVFRDEASPGMRAKVCSDLGWKRVSDDSCRNPDPSRTPVRIAECL